LSRYYTFILKSDRTFEYRASQPKDDRKHSQKAHSNIS